MIQIRNSLVFSFVLSVFVVWSGLLHAQVIATSNQSIQSATDLGVMIQALETTTPMSASQLPDNARGFYSAQNPDWPPMPGDVFWLPIWPLGDGLYVLDDTSVNYVELQAAAQTTTTIQSQNLFSRTGLSPMFSLISGSGGTPVYLTNLVATPTNGNVTVTFSIAGGTNGFAYDIFSTTNLANSPVYSTWSWLGQGYTSNTYTFTSQPFDNAFYILAKPEQTMVVAWGDDSAGQCDVPLGLTNAIDVAGGYNKFSLALKADGTVVAWGDNTYGETNVPAGLTNVVALAAGQYHSVALKADGTLVQWGVYLDGNNHIPVGSAPTNSDFVAIAAGSGHDIGLKVDGTVVTWGVTNNDANFVPTNVIGVKAIACGLTHNVALLTNGTVRVWGFNGEGFGWNITNVPTGLSNVIAIAAGAYHSLALKADGKVTAWGAGTINNGGAILNDYGQSIVPEGLTNVVTVAGGGNFSMALKYDGTTIGWGEGPFGQKNLPGRMAGVKAISAGGFHCLAIRSGQLTPVILIEPSNQYAVTGGTATFSSLGAGVAGVTYQWQFNGMNITGATNATLTLINMQTTNEGYYQVVISNTAGSVTSDAVIFALVFQPQIISTSPALGLVWVTNSINDGPVVNFPLNVAATDASPAQYPLFYEWSFEGANIATTLNPTYTLSLYNYWSAFVSAEGNYAVTVTNAAGSTHVGTWNVRILQPGMVAAWGDDVYGECDRPVKLTNVVGLAAGAYYSVALQDNGNIVQWGKYWSGGTNFVPVGTPPTNANLVAVSAGIDDAIALKSDGTVMEWGVTDSPALANFPTNLARVKAISAGWYRNLALLTNGSIVDWGFFAPTLGFDQRVPADLTNATAIACGAYHNLAVRGNGTVECWGYNDSGQTSVPAGLSNVVAVAGGGKHSLALRTDGTVVAWGDNAYGQCSVPTNLGNVMAISAGYYHSVALKNDGTVVAWGDNTYSETNVPNTLTRIKFIAAGGYHTLAAMSMQFYQYPYPPLDVTKDLLLIYNTNSVDSTTVLNYYLAHRPMVSEANVLGIGCTTAETITPSEFNNTFIPQIQNWQNNNPTKRPQYVILFPDIPSRVNTNSADENLFGPFWPSVQYQLSSSCVPGWNPFVTSINFNGTNDCIGYINKLASFGTNNHLVISASAGGYGNTNYVVDDVNSGYCSDPVVQATTNGIVAAGVPLSAIQFLTGCETLTNLPHLTNAVDVAGYIGWGAHSSLGGNYPFDKIQWLGNSGWWIIRTEESFNGQRNSSQGNFLKWFASNAFGGTNYSTIPVGGPSYVDEPGDSGTDNTNLFRLWAAGQNLAICAWNANNTHYLQVVGDPFVIR